MTIRLRNGRKMVGLTDVSQELKVYGTKYNTNTRDNENRIHSKE